MTNKSILEEKYPHVAKNLVLFWGFPEFREYTEGLIQIDPSRPNRQGFDPDALSDILILRELALQLGFINTPNQDPWHFVNRGKK